MKDIKDENQLLIPEINIVTAAYESDEKLIAIIETIEKECLSEVMTVETKAGRDRIKSQAYKISRSKTAMDEVGKGLTDEANKLIKMVNARRNIVKDRMDALRDKVRQPLTDWEAIDDKRKKDIQDRINECFGLRTLPESSVELRAIQDTTIGIELDETWQEFVEEATKAKDAFLRLLAGKIQDAVRIEEREAALERERLAQAAELERLREAQAVREREDALRKEEEDKQAAALAAKDEELAAMKAQLEAALQKPASSPVEVESSPSPTVEKIDMHSSGDNFNTVAKIEPHNPLGIGRKPTAQAPDPLFTEEQQIAAAILAILKQCTSRQASAAEIASAIIAGQIPHVKATF